MVDRKDSDAMGSLPQLYDSSTSPEVIQPGLEVHMPTKQEQYFPHPSQAPPYPDQTSPLQGDTHERQRSSSIVRPLALWLLVLFVAALLALIGVGGGLGYEISHKNNELQTCLSTRANAAETTSNTTTSSNSTCPVGTNTSDNPWANWTCVPNTKWTSNLTNLDYTQWCDHDIAVGGGSNTLSAVVQFMDQCITMCDTVNTAATPRMNLAVWSSNGNKYGTTGAKNAVGACFCAPATNGYKMANVQGVYAFLRDGTFNDTTLIS